MSKPVAAALESFPVRDVLDAGGFIKMPARLAEILAEGGCEVVRYITLTRNLPFCKSRVEVRTLLYRKGRQ